MAEINGYDIPVDYAKQYEKVKAFYDLTDSNGNKLVIIDEKNHTIKLSKHLDPFIAEYLLSCINVLLDQNKPCAKIAREIWYRRKESGNPSLLKPYNNFVKGYNTWLDDNYYKLIKDGLTQHKHDVILPDLLYFFAKSDKVTTTDTQETLTNEFTLSIQTSILQNNMILGKNKDGK